HSLKWFISLTCEEGAEVRVCVGIAKLLNGIVVDQALELSLAGVARQCTSNESCFAVGLHEVHPVGRRPWCDKVRVGTSFDGANTPADIALGIVNGSSYLGVGVLPQFVQVGIAVSRLEPCDVLDEPRIKAHGVGVEKADL